MSIKKTLLLTIILAAFAGFIYFFEMPKAKQAEQMQAEDKKLLSIDWDALDQIELVRPVKRYIAPGKLQRTQTVVLEKEGDSWYIREPVQDIADNYQVTSIINAIRFGSVTRRLEIVDTPLSKFGLPNLEFSAAFSAGGIKQTIQIGAKYKIGGALFVKRTDQTEVLIVADSIEGALRKDVSDIRESKIFREETGPVVELKIEHGDTQIVLERQPIVVDGKTVDLAWKIIKPVQDYADSKAVDELVQTIQNLTASDFIGETRNQDKNYGLTQPTLKISLGSFEQPVKTDLPEGMPAQEPEIAYKILRVGTINEGTSKAFAALDDSPFVVTIHTDSLRSLKVSANDLRDKHVAKFGQEAVNKIGLQIGGSLAIISDSGSGWAFKDGSQADPNVCNAIIEGFKAMQGEIIAEGKQASPDQYGVTAKSDWIELSKADGKVLSHLVFGDTNQKLGSIIAAQLSGGTPVIYNLALEEIAFLPGSIDKLILPPETISKDEQAADSAPN